MVACGVFLLLLAFTVLFFDLSRRANRKADTHSDAYREGALALRHLRQELKGSFDVRVTEAKDSPNSYPGVIYKTALWKEGRIVVDHRGLPVSGGSRLIRFSDGKLERYDIVPNSDDSDSRNWTSPRVLSTLGESGAVFGTDDVKFTLSSEQLLTITITVIKAGKFQNENNRSRQNLTMTVGLPNTQYWNEDTILKWD